MKKRTCKPSIICIHHSATADGAVLEDSAAIKRYHTSYRHDGESIDKATFDLLKTSGAAGLEEPWGDVGYHFLVERVLRGVVVRTGRSMLYEGAHCPPINATSIGICLVGNYDLSPPDTQMLDALAQLVKRLMDEYGISPGGVHFHNEYSTKSCPGKQFPYAGFLLACAGEERPV